MIKQGIMLSQAQAVFTIAQFSGLPMWTIAKGIEANAIKVSARTAKREEAINNPSIEVWMYHQVIAGRNKLYKRSTLAIFLGLYQEGRKNPAVKPTPVASYFTVHSLRFKS